MRRAISRAKSLARQTGSEFCVVYNEIDKCYSVKTQLDRYEYIVAVVAPDGMVINHEAMV